MRINKKVIDVYDNEFNVLIEKLKDMNKLERRELYVSHSKILFPRRKEVINLEDQISGTHDYLHKFKRSFFIIGNLFSQQTILVNIIRSCLSRKLVIKVNGIHRK